MYFYRLFVLCGLSEFGKIAFLKGIFTAVRTLITWRKGEG